MPEFLPAQAPSAKRAKLAESAQGMAAQLNAACTDGRKDEVKQILEKLSAKPATLRAALQTAVDNGHEDIVELLLQPRDEGGGGLTLEDVRACGPSLLESAAREDGCGSLWALLRGVEGLTADDLRVGNNAALRAACEAGNDAALEMLFESRDEDGGGLTREDAVSSKVLVLTCGPEGGWVDVVDVLVKPVSEGGAGLTTEDVCADDNAALRAACREGHTQIVEFLLRPDAAGGIVCLGKEDVLAKDGEALKSARASRNSEIIDMLNFIVDGKDVMEWGY